MSEEKTEEMNDGARSDFERIMLRFDSIDSRLRTLEEKAEHQVIETKPMWERALTEIAETRIEMRENIERVRIEMREGFAKLERKLDVINHELLEVKAEQRRLDSRVDSIEQRPS
jgi:hypothetical protein